MIERIMHEDDEKKALGVLMAIMWARCTNLIWNGCNCDSRNDSGILDVLQSLRWSWSANDTIVVG